MLLLLQIFLRKQSRRSTPHFILLPAIIPAVMIMIIVQMKEVMKAAMLEHRTLQPVEEKKVMMGRKVAPLALLLSDLLPLNEY